MYNALDIYICIYIYRYVIHLVCYTCVYMRYGFYFLSGVSTLDFCEWGIVFHVLALCLVESTKVLRRREDLRLPTRFSFSGSTILVLERPSPAGWMLAP